jgi:hypothetical protein
MREATTNQEQAHAQHSVWESLVHYAHYAHLSAEAIEFGSHAAQHARAVVAAQKLIKTHAQMAYDLARMDAHVRNLRRIAAAGGSAGETAIWRGFRARGLYGATRLAFESERPAVNAARAFLNEIRAAQTTPWGVATAKVGQAALRLETALQSSRVGSGLLKAARFFPASCLFEV